MFSNINHFGQKYGLRIKRNCIDKLFSLLKLVVSFKSHLFSNKPVKLIYPTVRNLCNTHEKIIHHTFNKLLQKLLSCQCSKG